MVDGKTFSDYRILARKYRPKNFSEIIGQDITVQVLRNAISLGKYPQGIIFTGIRGVGKTTLARIIAKCLNYVGSDGSGIPTADPKDDCPNCKSIDIGSHVDVIEIDAASHTGVEDIRKIIDSARYRPVSARYKIYIIDEVHMLSKSAFNAILKTLEEPPEHVKFIFATTEVNKVPLTILSRCQRFDLKRVGIKELIKFFADVAAEEGTKIGTDALSLIASASDGSVRDGLSLLDTVLSAKDDSITIEDVREILGLVNKEKIYELFDFILKADIEKSLICLRNIYEQGADAESVLKDLLEITHWLTRLKAVPQLLEGEDISEIDVKKGKEIAEKLSIPILTRIWQMLLKGLQEIKISYDPVNSFEMIIMRIAYASNLPSLDQLLESSSIEPKNDDIHQASLLQSKSSVHHNLKKRDGDKKTTSSKNSSMTALAVSPKHDEGFVQTEEKKRDTDQHSHIEGNASMIEIKTFADVLDQLEVKKEVILQSHLKRNVHLIKFAIGNIELRLKKSAPKNLAGELSDLLKTWTGKRWVISLSQEEGLPTVLDQEVKEKEDTRQEILTDTLVAKIIKTFPDSGIEIFENNDNDREVD